MKRRALLVGVLIGSFALPARALPSFAEVKAAHPTSETLFLDRHGELLQRLRTDPTVRQGAWVALPEVSPALRGALVYSEDRRFYEHSGVDWQAVAAAAWGNLWNTRTRGASTLTMQLAGLLDSDLQAGGRGRSWTQKAGQAVWAQWRPVWQRHTRTSCSSLVTTAAPAHRRSRASSTQACRGSSVWPRRSRCSC